MKRLPNQTIFFLFVVRQYCKIDREAYFKANYILPIRRQTVLQNWSWSVFQIKLYSSYTSSEGVVKLVVQRLPDQTIFFLYVVRRYSKIDREASSKSNYFLPIRRQTVLQNWSWSVFQSKLYSSYTSSDSTAKLIVQRLPNQTIFFLYVVRRCSINNREASFISNYFFLYVVRRYSKINRETSSKSNYILPIGRQTVLQNWSCSVFQIKLYSFYRSSEGVVRLIVKRLPNQKILFLYLVRQYCNIDREASSK